MHLPRSLGAAGMGCQSILKNTKARKPENNSKQQPSNSTAEFTFVLSAVFVFPIAVALFCDLRPHANGSFLRE
jgi:hypothetical protein